MNYRCPTCTTHYRTSAGDADPGYVRCRVCGFLIDTGANRVRGGSAAVATASPAAPRRWPVVAGGLLVLLGLAWVMAIVLRNF